MINAIRKLHELQLMAVGRRGVSVHIDVYDTGKPFWSLRVVYWHDGSIKKSINIDAFDPCANHRIDMMLKYKTLEK